MGLLAPSAVLLIVFNTPLPRRLPRLCLAHRLRRLRSQLNSHKSHNPRAADRQQAATPKVDSSCPLDARFGTLSSADPCMVDVLWKQERSPIGAAYRA